MMKRMYLLILAMLVIQIISVCSKNKFTVTWVNYDGEVLEIDENVKNGSSPQYNGAIPYRPSDGVYEYKFNYFVDSSNVKVTDEFEITQDYIFTAKFGRSPLNQE